VYFFFPYPYVRYVHVARPSIFIRDILILSSEKMLHKDYDRNDLVEIYSCHELQRAWRQGEQNGGKPPVVK
jgi:hypothetical protein